MARIKLMIKLFLYMTLAFFISTTNANSDTGYDVAKKITQRYFDNQIYCGDDGLPIFLCSGVLIRGTVASNKYHSWNPSPKSQSRGSVSFSYLRSDVKVIALYGNHHNGYIFSPYLDNIDSPKVNPEALCYFPIDGDTDDRSDKGCGSSLGHQNRGSCQQQNVTTAEQWVNYYANNRDAQCGFDVTGDGSANIFMQAIKVRSLIDLPSNNELLLATWEQDIPEKLPIEAFFYQNDGLQDAQHDQKDFYQSTGTLIPIIKITFPQNKNEDILFTYDQGDQININ
ncbi:hypothetical protein Xbed_02290 [Xenorhabdus beddingii]|uniref:Uncharacterized protein n=1 Tax=Xenorhabdus beddingii TaxID=40578 RepID=A0A1Y2SL56_9GAMM|nr:hypothetical protein [Xenorhabdus beddingii]OTA19610.1 hypothetical protein Xbed_02290 [Xenorhabdus beddingii]